jgi:CDP-diacylglycerol--glycerol-3-phosphate 3-phosphatidyltransferase
LITRSTIPNAITVARIALCPAIAFLIFVPTFTARLAAFILFLIAAFSDLVDGHLARKHAWISDFGKLLDPVADKLLLAVTMVPVYMLSQRSAPDGKLPIIGELPLWVVLVIFAREILVTVIRAIAARNGTVIPARGHFLAVNSAGYSLSSYPAGNGNTATANVSYNLNIPDNAGIALFKTSASASFNAGNLLDAVGSAGEANILYKEGSGYANLAALSLNSSWYRHIPASGLGAGLPQDTGINSADFRE